METGIRVKQAGTSMQQHKPSLSLSKQTEIVKLLTKFSLSRRAAINPETLALDASDLSIYELSDIAEAIEILRKRGRADGESAYPEINTFEEAVRGVIRARKPTVDQEAADRWLKYLEAAKAEGITEPYLELKERMAFLNEKYSLAKPKVIDTTPVMQACPHCSQELPVGPNIRFWTPEELRGYANVLESNINARIACEQVPQ